MQRKNQLQKRLSIVRPLIVVFRSAKDTKKAAFAERKTTLIHRTMLSFQQLEMRQLLAASLSIPVDIPIDGEIPSEVEVYSSSQGRIVAVHGQIRMDDAQPGLGYSYNEFVLRVDMQGMKDIRLSFDHDSINDEKHTIPSQYAGRVRGDGVSVSVDDGQTWYRVVQLDRDFRNRSFDLDAIILDAGLAYSLV